MSLTKKLLLGLITGTALGLILGERVAPAKVIADGFVRLLQMTVLPYLLVSLISSLGALNLKDARQLGLRAGAILALLWGVGLGYAMLFPLVFPKIPTGAFFIEASRDVLARHNLSNGSKRDLPSVVVTSHRASSMLFSEPYQEETLAFLVKDYLRDRFSSWDSIRSLGPIRISTPNLPYFMSLLHEKLPDARLEPIGLELSNLAKGSRPDVLLMSAERGSILTLLAPEYSIIVPQPGTIKLPVAYPIA